MSKFFRTFLREIPGALRKALSADGNPEFVTVAGVLKSLGLRLSVAA
jgi:DNA-binding phage protein